MESFLEKLDTLLDHDPFADINSQLLSPNDLELVEKYRAKSHEERQRIRHERKTKTFEQIMEELAHELSYKPDLSSFYRTLDEPVQSNNSIRHDVHKIELDTSDDEQDDLDHCTTYIDPTKSIGRPITSTTTGDELQTSTYVVYPLTKSPSVPTVVSRPLKRYADQTRRNTYTLKDSASSSSSSSSVNRDPPLINTKREYIRLHSEGFDPEEENHLFDQVKDARSTFSLPKKTHQLTEQQAQRILYEKLAAFVKGHLTRQLFRTEHVKQLIQTLHDTRKFAVDFQNERLETKTRLDPEDINIIDQLIRQVEAVLNEIHAIFGQYPAARRMLMILRHEQAQLLRTKRTEQRMMSKDGSQAVINRPIIDPLPTSNDHRQTRPTNSNQSDYSRPEPIRRRHVTSVSSKTTNRPVKKTASVQRPSRPANSTNVPSSSTNPPRSSSANPVIRPPLRLAPASPLFRNRLK